MNDSRNEARLDLDEIRALVQIASEAPISELAVEAAHLKVVIKKGGGTMHVQTAPAVETSANPHGSSPAETAAAPRLVPIAAPMVGTFYRAPSPDAPPFVEDGDMVEAGQTVCVIEAMKLFNEIPSEVRGRIVRALVENGHPVEYGQLLFLVDPTTA